MMQNDSRFCFFDKENNKAHILKEIDIPNSFGVKAFTAVCGNKLQELVSIKGSELELINAGDLVEAGISICSSCAKKVNM